MSAHDDEEEHGTALPQETGPVRGNGNGNGRGRPRGRTGESVDALVRTLPDGFAKTGVVFFTTTQLFTCSVLIRCM